jgi:hypothetical protein
MIDATVTNGQLATHLSDLLETVSDKSLATDETAKTSEINDSTTTDMDVLFDELTSLKDRAKEKALNATALQLSKNDNVTETAAVNSDALDEKFSVVTADTAVDPVGRDVFAGTHSIGVAQDTVVSSKTTDIPVSSAVSSPQDSNVSSSQKSDVIDKSLIKVFAVNGQVYWYNRDKLVAHSTQAIAELSEQDAIASGMRHSNIEGPTAKTYFTKEELEARCKKDVPTTENTGAAVKGIVDTNTKSLPRTGDVPVSIPLASTSVGLGVALLTVLKKREKKD